MFEAILAGIIVVGGGCLYICIMYATAWAIATRFGKKTDVDGFTVLIFIMVCSIFIGASFGALSHMAREQVKEERSF